MQRRYRLEAFLTSCEPLKDERFDLKQLLNYEDDNFELNSDRCDEKITRKVDC